jgi:hypothetical protein
MERSGKLGCCPRGDACRPRVKERHNGIGGPGAASLCRSEKVYDWPLLNGHEAVGGAL